MIVRKPGQRCLLAFDSCDPSYATSRLTACHCICKDLASAGARYLSHVLWQDLTPKSVAPFIVLNLGVVRLFLVFPSVFPADAERHKSRSGVNLHCGQLIIFSD